MAANVTRLELRTRIRFEADMVSSTRATDADINRLINTHLAELYDRLVAAGPPDYYSTTSTISVVSGTISYALPADFRSLVALYVQESSTRLREIVEMREGTLAAYDAPNASSTLTLKYVPAPPSLDDDADTYDGISGWDELIVQLCARALYRRERRDTAQFSEAIAEARQRVQSNAPKRALGGPRYVNDTEAADGWSYWSNIQQSVEVWKLEGDYIKLYRAASVWP